MRHHRIYDNIVRYEMIVNSTVEIFTRKKIVRRWGVFNRNTLNRREMDSLNADTDESRQNTSFNLAPMKTQNQFSGIPCLINKLTRWSIGCCCRLLVFYAMFSNDDGTELDRWAQILYLCNKEWMKTPFPDRRIRYIVVHMCMFSVYKYVMSCIGIVLSCFVHSLECDGMEIWAAETKWESGATWLLRFNKI